MSIIKKCFKGGAKMTPPEFVISQLQYEVIMGSQAYGCNTDASDMDVYGWCIPVRNYVFPWEHDTFIAGFDNPNRKFFEQYQQHHVMHGEKEYDFTIFSITKAFLQCMKGAPNMIDMLFVPRNLITHSTKLGELVREERHIFLTKKLWHSFKGYAYSQLGKMQSKNPEGKRVELVKKYGYDVKFASHVVRLLNEIEQIMTEKDLDLLRSRKQLMSIRRGEWKKEDILNYFHTKELELEKVYHDCDLPNLMQFAQVREFLIKCLKIHYTDDTIDQQNNSMRADALIDQIQKLIVNHKLGN